jgi:hypothetical protein
MRVTVASRVGLAVTIPCIVGGLVLGPRAHLSRDWAPARQHDSSLARGVNDPSQALDNSSVSDGDVDEPVDLYGNPVTDAVADYRLDSAGSLYESHSPQTEIPKLASPKS